MLLLDGSLGFRVKSCMRLHGTVARSGQLSGLFHLDLPSLLDHTVYGVDQAMLVVLESEVDNVNIQALLLELMPLSDISVRKLFSKLTFSEGH